jgi:hypothetical protein
MDQLCPVCRYSVPPQPRYPRALCRACVGLACDAHGRPLTFENESLSGGILARYRDSGTIYLSQECWVRGMHCLADEHHLGGIVVQPLSV